MLALIQQPQDYISAISELAHAGYLVVTKGLLRLQALSLPPEQRGRGGGNCYLSAFIRRVKTSLEAPS